jgi:hypothetical protein
MNFRLSKKRDIVLDMVEKKNKPKKQKAIKMSDMFQTKNSKVIYKPKNTITQVLNDTQKIQMDKLIRKHKER